MPIKTPHVLSSGTFPDFYPHPDEFSEGIKTSLVALFSAVGVSASIASAVEAEELVCNLLSLCLIACFIRRSRRRAVVFFLASFSLFLEDSSRLSSSCSSAHRIHGLLGKP